MPTPGKNFPSSPAYFPTPDSLPETSACRTFRVPDNDEWLGVLMAAVEVLRQSWRWYPWGALTADEAADAWNDIIIQAYDDSFEDTCPVTTVPTPYWDDDADVDDESEKDVQPWYGYVTDPEAPADELTFVEQASIWAFTAFLAVATWEVGAAPAILFNTIAPRFVLAVRRGDAGEIIRILIDGQDSVTIDTSSAAVGDVVRVPITADPALSTHDIMLIQVS